MYIYTTAGEHRATVWRLEGNEAVPCVEIDAGNLRAPGDVYAVALAAVERLNGKAPERVVGYAVLRDEGLYAAVFRTADVARGWVEETSRPYTIVRLVEEG